jgi:hypothetical protein
MSAVVEPNRPSPAASPVRREVARVVGRVGGPACAVAEHGPHGEQEAADAAGPAALGHGRRVRLRQHEHRNDREHHRQHGEGEPLEDLHEVVPEERDADLHQHHDDEAARRGQAGQRVQRERGADAVDREPAEAGRDRHQAGRQRVAAVTEREPAQHHLRDARSGPARRQHTVGQRREPVAEQDGRHGLRERQPEHQHGQDADEDRRELEVGGGPGPEELARAAVPLGLGDRFVATRLDGNHAAAVLAVGGDRAG